jgi:uncharacterized ferritin-like protein (DUF455 family)
MAERTKYSFADRMAMVPRTLEARGLDACPVMQEKFRQAGETHTAQILDIILRDEITHVALGHRWFIHALRNISTNRYENTVVLPSSIAHHECVHHLISLRGARRDFLKKNFKHGRISNDPYGIR